MNEFIATALSFPTIVFSILFACSLILWILSLLTGGGDTSGGVDGALDAGIDGALDAGIDGALDAGIDGALDAGIDGVIDAGVDGALDAGVQPGASDGLISVLVSALGLSALRTIPVSISGGLFALWAWAMSYLIEALAGTALSAVLTRPVYGILSMLVVAVAAARLTSICARPLQPLFRTQNATRHDEWVGTTCRVSTGRVDDRFGQAIINVGGAPSLVQVRCDTGGRLQRGETALIIGYDPIRRVYQVEPYDEIVGHSAQNRPRDATTRHAQDDAVADAVTDTTEEVELNLRR